MLVSAGFPLNNFFVNGVGCAIYSLNNSLSFFSPIGALIFSEYWATATAIENNSAWNSNDSSEEDRSKIPCR